MTAIRHNTDPKNKSKKTISKIAKLPFKIFFPVLWILKQPARLIKFIYYSVHSLACCFSDRFFARFPFLSKSFYLIYKLSYLTGIHTIRFGRYFVRRVKKINTHIRPLQRIYSLIEPVIVFFARIIIRLYTTLYKDVKHLAAGFSKAKKRMDSAFQKGTIYVLMETVKIFLLSFRYNKKIIARSLNYIAPVFALFILNGVVHQLSSNEYVLHLEYKGVAIGYILDESVFDEASTLVDSRVVEDADFSIDKNPNYKLAVVPHTELISSEQLCNKLIEISGNVVGEGCGLYVDNQFIGAVTDKNELEKCINLVLDKYRTGAAGEKVEFAKQVEIKSALFPVDSFKDIEEIKTKLLSNNRSEVKYTVQKGDAPLSIAAKNDMTYSELKSLNPSLTENIRPGDSLLIAKAEPFLPVKVSKTITYKQNIPYETERISDSSQYSGYTKLQRKGVLGEEQITAEVTYINNLEVSRNVLDRKVLKNAVTEQVVVGTKNHPTYISTPVGNQNVKTSFAWPVAGGRISCGWLGYRGHYAVDIAAPRGTPLVATADGVISSVRSTRYGYGNHFTINHGGGVQTLYAHCYQIYVKEGQSVKRGQVIGTVGMTGNATGNHLHFEIIINGKKVNPTLYIGK